MVWFQCLAFALVNASEWKADDNGEGMAVARFFVRVESTFGEKGFSTEEKENMPLQQSGHCLGWHCIRAFEALEAGNPAGYVRELQEGLEENPAIAVLKVALHIKRWHGC